MWYICCASSSFAVHLPHAELPLEYNGRINRETVIVFKCYSTCITGWELFVEGASNGSPPGTDNRDISRDKLFLSTDRLVIFPGEAQMNDFSFPFEFFPFWFFISSEALLLMSQRPRAVSDWRNHYRNLWLRDEFNIKWHSVVEKRRRSRSREEINESCI